MVKKCLLLTNIPAPYRESVHKIIFDEAIFDYEVIFCAQIESNRQWTFERKNYRSTTLSSKVVTIGGRDIFLGSNIVEVLFSKNPDVLIISGFSLPMLVAFVWAKLKRKKIISFTDAHIDFESRLTVFHKMIRKIVYGRSDACVGASKKSIELFAKYGAKPEICFQSHLCANNNSFPKTPLSFEEREYDVMICGRICKEKMSEFLTALIILLKKEKNDLRVLIVGDGPERVNLIKSIETAGVNFLFTGFVTQQELPKYYSSSKIFLFPSINDAWGVVANEACAAGTPTISCSKVGAVGELLINNFNSIIVETNIDKWAFEIIKLLNDRTRWSTFSLNSKRLVEDYNYSNAAYGIIKAVEVVCDEK